MPFPIIRTIGDLLPHVAHKPEIRREDKSNGMTVLCYMIAGHDTFDSDWARECRGIVFGPDGRIAARPLHKFFNVGERPETQPEALAWSSAARVMDKRDGSLVHTVRMPNPSPGKTTSIKTHWDVKSKKSFESHIAVAARAWLAERPRFTAFCQHVAEQGLTAIFEWTAPDCRIVIDYGAEPALQLLHVRDNITGEYASYGELSRLANAYDLTLVASAFVSGDPLAASAKAEGVEGWVYQFANGDMVKLKTTWYLDRHHTMTALRNRDVARAVVEETVDDLKSILTLAGVDIAPILAVETRVLDATNAIRAEVSALHRATVGMERKDIAIKHKTHPYFSLLMNAVSGKEPDVNTYFDRYVLNGMFDLDLVMRP